MDTPWLKAVSGKAYGDEFTEEGLDKARSFYDTKLDSK